MLNQNLVRTRDAELDCLAKPRDQRSVGDFEIIERVFDVFEHAYLLVDRDTSQLIWVSAGAESVLPELHDESFTHLRKIYPELFRPIEAVDGELDPVTLMVSGKSLQIRYRLMGHNHAALMISADVTEYSQMSKYMADREKLFTTSRTISVSEMATTLAHEINQPVGSISNILKGLKARLKKTDSVEDECFRAIDRALEQTNFAARIISRIRDFTAARQPNRVDCDVRLLLQDSIQLLDWVLINAAVDIELTPVEEKIWVNVDATMLQQVFTNLIRNAVEAMGNSESSQRMLKINTKKQGGEVQIEIADNGHGLSESEESALFVPFVTQKTQGMGVGLNICRSFVELHQGKLWLIPNDEGGCTASVLLPVVERDSDFDVVQHSGH